MEKLAYLINDMEIDGKCNFKISKSDFNTFNILENTDPVYIYFFHHGFIEELVEEDDIEFFLVMGFLMVMVVCFWFFSRFITLTFIFFFRLFFIFGFLFF
jgi:hypothetical protein